MSDPARLYIALTSDCGETATAMMRPLEGLRVGVKIGLELFTRSGPAIVRQLREMGFDIFLDLKFSDIPSTVAGAVTSACLLKPAMLNVHAMGGLEMMRAAADAARGSGTRVIAVTVLTSLGAQDLGRMGISSGPGELAALLASSAAESGLDGVVCSPLEASGIRQAHGRDFLIVTPGIRPRGADTQDQKRTSTAYDAILSGATSLVVGRPVTGASDPRDAAVLLLEEIDSALEARGV
jgi:orotidine-5'-phosphate decarboxylase